MLNWFQHPIISDWILCMAHNGHGVVILSKAKNFDTNCTSFHEYIIVISSAVEKCF